MRIKIDHKAGTYRLEIERQSYLMEEGVSIVVEVDSFPRHLHDYRRRGSLRFSVLEEVDAAPVVEVAAAPEPVPEASSDSPPTAPVEKPGEVKKPKRTKQRKSGES